MSKHKSDNSRKQRRKQDKARRRQKENIQRALWRKQAAAKRAEKFMAGVAASDAFGMPALYRSFQLCGKPEFNEDCLSLAELELRLVWHETQEGRDAGEEAEPVSSLCVDSCIRITQADFPKAGIWAGLPELQLYRCSARLAEHVDPNCIYGRWLRMQENQGELHGDEPYAEVGFDFVLVLGRATDQVVQLLEPQMTALQPLRFVRGKLNVFDVAIVDRDNNYFSELQVDRWFEFISMLKLLIPRLQGEPVKSDMHHLKGQLEQIEQEERTLAAELQTLSERSIAAWEELKLRRAKVELQTRNYREAVQKVTVAKGKAAARLSRARQEISRLEGVRRKAESSALTATRKGDQKNAERFRAETEAASAKLIEYERRIPGLESDVRRHEQRLEMIHRDNVWQSAEAKNALVAAEIALRQAKEAEAPVSKSFEFAFLRREEILSDIRLLEANLQESERR